jgi:hypothetical protein
MFVFTDYCCNTFQPQFLVIFREFVVFFDVCRLYVNLFANSFTYVIKFTIKIKQLKSVLGILIIIIIAIYVNC